MKKIGMILLLAVCCQLGSAKTPVKKLLEKFTNKEDVEKVVMSVGKNGQLSVTEVGGVAIDASAPGDSSSVGGKGLLSRIKGISSVVIYDLDDCDDPVKKQFTKTVRSIDDPEWEILLTENDEDDYVRIVARIEKKIVQEMVVFCAGDDCTIVHIQGKIDLKNLQKLLGSRGNEQ